VSSHPASSEIIKKEAKAKDFMCMSIRLFIYSEKNQINISGYALKIFENWEKSKIVILMEY
jgi:hypothetical protein